MPTGHLLEQPRSGSTTCDARYKDRALPSSCDENGLEISEIAGMPASARGAAIGNDRQDGARRT